MIAAYADAAERIKAGGLDGLEIECYGHLIDQFWSPATNKRDDEYGGALANRTRFAFEVLRAIRDRVGPEFIVGVRMVCDEDWERGLTKREGLAIAQSLVASGQIDFVNVIRGHIDTEEALSHVIPGMGERSAPHLEFAGEIRAATRIPTFHAARIQDVATARYAIAEGKLDLVGMTRAHLADPHIARKIMEGREDEIRPCVGMGYCIDSIYAGQALCVHNPSTGREQSMPHVIARSDGLLRKFIVVGAGPAGLEAARVAGARGHKVVLFEAGDKPGGQVRVAAGLARRREIMGIVDWRVAQCAKYDVELRTSTFAEAAEIEQENPDVVVIATGGVPNLGFLDEGEDLATTSWDVLTGAAKLAGSVIVYDDNGAHPGVSVAEFAARAGAKVEFVTPERSLAPDVGATSFPPICERSQSSASPSRSISGWSAFAGKAIDWWRHFSTNMAPSGSRRRPIRVVVEHGSKPADELYFELKPGSRNLGEVDYPALIAQRPQAVEANPRGAYQLYRIGDAVSSRNIHAAIYDALRLIRTM